MINILGESYILATRLDNRDNLSFEIETASSRRFKGARLDREISEPRVRRGRILHLHRLFHWARALLPSQALETDGFPRGPHA
ncbi:hypothetical protein A9Q97_04715 [Rhodospirillales bacterium 47_12_T64]|mgnify:CR=1 FL=1|nr:hypothetical protein A9Q97_04715 [Rhodospirillales bacterium 47_12_T64]